MKALVRYLGGWRSTTARIDYFDAEGTFEWNGTGTSQHRHHCLCVRRVAGCARLLSLLAAMVYATLGCGHQPAAQRAGSSGGFSDVVLKQLADAGAVIELERLADSRAAKLETPADAAAVLLEARSPLVSASRRLQRIEASRELANRKLGRGASEAAGDSVLIFFQDIVIDQETAQSLAQLLDSDRRDGRLASFDELANASGPVKLFFEKCQIGREQLAAVNGAKRLFDLTFIDTHLDDTSFADVSSLPGLHKFWLADKSIGDDGLRFLETSPRLEKLHLSETRAGDVTLQRVRGAIGIRELALRRSRVTDTGLSYVAAMTNLAHVDLSGCDVTDQGIAHLAAIGNLRHLDLSGTKVTDSGVRQLRGLLGIAVSAMFGIEIKRSFLIGAIFMLVHMGVGFGLQLLMRS